MRRWRRRRRPRGVTLGRGVRLGRGVQLDAAPGARIVLGDGCVLGEGTRILARAGTVSIGAGAVLGERCTLLAEAGIAIGAGARLADRVAAVDFDHRTGDPETPIRLQGIDAAPIAIGDRVQLGPGASVLRGVCVGDDAVVGAYAVVTRDVPAGVRVDGVPAASLKPRPAAARTPGTSSRRSSTGRCTS